MVIEELNESFSRLKGKSEVNEYAKKHPSVGSRELAAKFSCGKSQINSILMSKKFLLERWASNDGGNMERTHGHYEQQYSEVNSICGSGINYAEHLTYQSVALCYRNKHLPSLKGLERIQGFKWLVREMENSAQHCAKKCSRQRR